MSLSLFEGVLGGIGLFLLGMRFLSDGIRTVADDRVRAVLATCASNRLYSLAFGMTLPLALNSANAAVIFVIGLANAGALNVFQAISVLGGVLAGAALSLHLPVMPYNLVATPFIFSGVILKFFARRRRFANAGDFLLGAGLLFLGLALLENSFNPSDKHPFYEVCNGLFFRNSFLALFFGGMFSLFVQSALSSLTIISSLISSYHPSVMIAANMTLGGIVGVAAIGALASVGGTSVSRRIAAAFFLTTLLAVLAVFAITPYLLELVGDLEVFPLVHAPGLIGRQEFSQLVWVYTVAGFLAALIATALSGVVSRKLSSGNDHGRTGVMPQPRAGYLDMRIINTPTLAIEQARKEIVRMTSVTSFMYADIREILSDFDARRAATIRQHEEVLDSLNHEITLFLAALAHSCANPEISYAIPGFLQTVSDLEHVGDRCEEILDCIIEKKEAGVVFSGDAMADLKKMAGIVETTFSQLENLIQNNAVLDQKELHNIKSEARLVFDQVNRAHFDRICAGVCPSRAAMLFNQLTDAFVRIAELCWNIMAIKGRKAE